MQQRARSTEIHRNYDVGTKRMTTCPWSVSSDSVARLTVVVVYFRGDHVQVVVVFQSRSRSGSRRLLRGGLSDS